MSAITIVANLAILCFAALVFSAAVSDILTYRIPNRLSLALALLYPTYVFAAPQPVDWLSAIGLASASLALGFALFSFKICGAGDAKLFAAVALWAGPAFFLPFMIMTTLAGGVIAVFIWLQLRLARAATPLLVFQTASDPMVSKQQMPYGAAIAVAALYVAFTLMRIS
jgi:prepilin peptidase CpaA